MTRSTTPPPPTHSGGRRWGHAQDDHLIDPYKRPKKLTEPTVCPQCGAVYHAGRWHWAERPKDAQETLCQACHRTNDHYPAGVVTLTGTLTALQRTELVNLARHQEEAEKAEHPLNRILSVVENPSEIVINTTEIHLPRRIGEAIERAFHGTLQVNFDQDAYFVRVNWQAKA